MKHIILTILAVTFGSMPLLAQPVIISQPASRALWVGGNVTFVVGVSNAGSFTYQWRLNGTNLPNGLITTVAGGAINDGIPATNAILNDPAGVAVDAHGDLFIADYQNHRICEIKPDGLLTLFAGNGLEAYSGDGGPATNASLNYPQGVAVDSSGNVIIADTDNNVIRKVNTNGIITTVAGNTANGYSGDGGAATNASLNTPVALALDSFGNLFIADSGNNGRVRKVDAAGIITTVAGGGTNGNFNDNEIYVATNMFFGWVSGITVDASGNLFISGGPTIYKVDTNGYLTTIPYWLGLNEITSALGISVDSAGNLYFSDYFGCIRKLSGATGALTTLAGNGTNGYSGDGGPATNASLNVPEGVAVDTAGNLFVADTLNHVIKWRPTPSLRRWQVVARAQAMAEWPSMPFSNFRLP
jgi:sugar lactone lactonase YvrE